LNLGKRETLDPEREGDPRTEESTRPHGQSDQCAPSQLIADGPTGKDAGPHACSHERADGGDAVAFDDVVRVDAVRAEMMEHKVPGVGAAWKGDESLAGDGGREGAVGGRGSPWMVGWDGEDEFVPEHGDRFEPFVRFLSDHDGEVDAAVEEGGDGPVSVGRFDDDRGLGVESVDLGDGLGEHGVSEGGRRGDAELALAPIADSLEGGSRGVHLDQDAIDMMQETFAGRGEGDATAGAFEQAAASEAFEMLDGVGNGALAETELGGGFGEAETAGEDLEDEELTTVEVGMV
jgi:hypothetical protein